MTSLRGSIGSADVKMLVVFWPVMVFGKWIPAWVEKRRSRNDY